MFSSENKNNRNMDTSTQQNIIAKGTEIKGDIVSQGHFRVDGTVDGNINTSGKVVIGKTGYIKGNLTGNDASVEGKFSGKLILTGTLSLKSTAQIDGEVQTNKLAVEPGATFNATCSMGGSVKALNNSKSVSREKSGKQA